MGLLKKNVKFAGLVRMRFIEADEKLSLRGQPLREAIESDMKQGLIPFWVRIPQSPKILSMNENYWSPEKIPHHKLKKNTGIP